MSDNRRMHTQASLQRAELLIETGRDAQAMELLLPLLEHGDSAEQEGAYLSIIQILLNQGQNQQAMGYTEKAIAAGFDGAAMRCMRAIGYYHDRLYQLALTQINKALEDQPQLAYAYYLKALCHLVNSELNSAEQAIERALSIEPDDSDYLTFKAEIRYLQDHEQESQTYLGQALAIDPFNRGALLTLADRESKKGRKKALVEQVLRHEPTDNEAQQALRALNSKTTPWMTTIFSLLAAALVFWGLSDIGGHSGKVTEVAIAVSLFIGWLFGMTKIVQFFYGILDASGRFLYFHLTRRTLRLKIIEWVGQLNSRWSWMIVMVAMVAMVATLAERGMIPELFLNSLFIPCLMLLVYRLRYPRQLLITIMAYLLLCGFILAFAEKMWAVNLIGSSVVVLLQSWTFSSWYLRYFR